MHRTSCVVGAAVLTVTLASCGAKADTNPAEAVSPSLRAEVVAATNARAVTFPKPHPGERLEQFAARFDTSRAVQAVTATTVYTTPRSRLAFGLIGADHRFTYGDTAVYVQARWGGPITGPIAAPADVLLTKRRFRSQQAASARDPFAAVYEANLPLRRPGVYHVLAVSRGAGKTTIAAPFEIPVRSKAQDPIPDVGERAPRVATDTLASVHGNVRMLDTRVPPARALSRQSFRSVVGRRPVALLFATPQLCQSRVCGPVTDTMLQMRHRYGDKMTFIHQEVYRDNDPRAGVRSPLRAFSLPSEPWLFTVSADGRIAARMEGSIGVRGFERAIRAALK